MTDEGKAAGSLGSREADTADTVIGDARFVTINADCVVEEVSGERRELGHVKHRDEAFVSYEQKRVFVSRQGAWVLQLICVISVEVIVKPSALFLLNEERGDIATACLRTREEKVVLVYCYIISRLHVLYLIGLEGFGQDERLSESLMNTTVPIIVTIVCPIEILVLNGDVLNLPSRVTRRAFVQDTNHISWVLFNFQQVSVHSADLALLAASRSLVLIDKEEVAKLVDCEAATADVGDDGTLFSGLDRIIDEGELVLGNMITVADVEISKFEIEGSVGRVGQVCDQRSPVAVRANI